MAEEIIPDPNRIGKLIEHDKRIDAITEAATFAAVKQELGGPLGEVLIKKGLNLDSLSEKIIELFNAKRSYSVLVPIYDPETGKRIGTDVQYIETPDYNIQSKIIALIIRATGLETALKIDHGGQIELKHSLAPQSLDKLRQREAQLQNAKNIVDAEILDD